MQANVPSFILASGSPRRARLLPKLGIPFEIIPSGVTETYSSNEAPAQIVQRLAIQKAKHLAMQKPDAIILGADTLVASDNHILGKPENEKQALDTLNELSASHHRVLTGVALIRTNEETKITDKSIFVETTTVQFGKISPTDMETYVKSGKPMDKAGAYGIQDDWGERFVKRIEGDYYNVMGLPLHRLYLNLKNFAPELFAETK